MPKVKITKDCDASENGVNIIKFTKDQAVVVSQPMKERLQSIKGCVNYKEPKGGTGDEITGDGLDNQEAKGEALETPEAKAEAEEKTKTEAEVGKAKK